MSIEKHSHPKEHHHVASTHSGHSEHGHLTEHHHLTHADLVHQSEEKIDKALKHNPHDFKPIFKELEHLRRTEGNKQFHKDLDEINHHLDHTLPHVHLMEQGKSFIAVADADNPQHAHVISRSEHAPRESAKEKHTYAHMHSNGWEHALGGGGGYEGHAFRSGPSFQIPTGDRKELIDEALKLAGLPVNPANESAVATIIQNESGWDPNSINLTDSNAAKGHPSQGLMQTIPETFHRYALSGYDSNINDPLSNIVAGIRYAKARYGSLSNTPGLVAMSEGRKYVGY